MTRAHLPNRRPGGTFKIAHFDPLAGPVGQGQSIRYFVTIGEYEDGKPGEVFITPANNPGKGSMLEAIARDAAILISLSLQYGVPIETMRKAVTRDEQNQPQTFVGAVLDAMEE